MYNFDKYFKLLYTIQIILTLLSEYTIKKIRDVLYFTPLLRIPTYLKPHSIVFAFVPPYHYYQ